MCTAINDIGRYHLFGRTLDLDRSYGEATVILPRSATVEFSREWASVYHFAMIGTATVVDGVPLFFDALNEKGLAAAALNFSDIAVYSNVRKNAHNVASFELIPWVLGRCESVSCAVQLLKDTNVTSDSFKADMPTTPLHWLIADGHESITVEPSENGLEIHKNPFGVLTNAPEFRFHSMNASIYMKVSPSEPENSLCPTVELSTYSRGMGGIGLPGDMSSASRFVRAVFSKEHTAQAHSEIEAVSRFFHIMETVSLPSGFARTPSDQPISTVYTSCACTQSKTYYYTTYADRRIRAVRLDEHSLELSRLQVFHREEKEDISYLN